LLERVGSLPESEVERLLEDVGIRFGARHKDLSGVLEEHFSEGCSLTGWKCDWSRSRRLVAGAYLTMEYAIESAGLFNPSIVPHPDQCGVPRDSVRFIMSLRATGEGHISSIVFRTGVIGSNCSVQMDPPARLLHRSRIAPDRHYLKHLFRSKLREMGVNGSPVAIVLDVLQERFTLADLHTAVQATSLAYRRVPRAREVVRTMLWLANSNYHIELPSGADISELVLFPMSAEEAHGIEDLRLVRFTEEDGEVSYFGTYTAFDGRRTLPMMISTGDFRRIEVHSLNGACARNKGMALFPRRIGGHFAMCARIDGENIHIMFSDYVHFWESAERLQASSLPWELVLRGNCGSPLETPEGWLLLTHGVGPMRQYAIGAILLDLEDPTRVIGHLRDPLIVPKGIEREGYVPNVAYTCGAQIHRGQLFLPYALADKSTSMAVVDLDELINCLLDSGKRRKRTGA
jgi:predicted GH43/DUF377 family glycosyl hydrolase